MKTITITLTVAVFFAVCGCGPVSAKGGGGRPAYRYYNHGAYKILDTNGFFLYSYYKLVQGEKIARPQTVYYFSLKANDPVEELTLANLENAFAGNTRFRYLVEGQFRSDKELIAYDHLLKTYKVKYLYSQSFK